MGSLRAASGTLPDVVEELGELLVADAAAWRAWLTEHHGDVPGVWLVLAKKYTVGCCRGCVYRVEVGHQAPRSPPRVTVLMTSISTSGTHPTGAPAVTGADVVSAIHTSPLGPLTLAASPAGLCQVAFTATPPGAPLVAPAA